MPEVMQVIPKTYDLILWLVPRLKEFPRDLVPGGRLDEFGSRDRETLGQR